MEEQDEEQFGEDYLTFDDILIVPAYSDIESRQEIDTSVSFLGTDLSVPIISANMDFVTGPEMAKEMQNNGGLGILHRFWESDSDYFLAMNQAAVSGVNPLYISVGIRDTKASLELIKASLNYGVSGVCIDVAHGHHKKVGEMIGMIKGHPTEEISRLKVIAGNVATIEGAVFLHESGADAIKVGIGAGSVCTTRTVAGIGVPQWSAILECSAVKQVNEEIIIIADGGVRSSGDIAKALSAGADVVMLGNMLAGTDEAPGEIVDGTYKRYRGQASFGSNGERYVKEGIEGMIPYKGPLAPVIQQIKAGVRSSMSYVGARNLIEFREKSRVVKVSSHTLMENSTRVTEYK
jgi:IMP dehydrogenase